MLILLVFGSFPQCFACYTFAKSMSRCSAFFSVFFFSFLLFIWGKLVTVFVCFLLMRNMCLGVSVFLAVLVLFLADMCC